MVKSALTDTENPMAIGPVSAFEVRRTGALSEQNRSEPLSRPTAGAEHETESVTNTHGVATLVPTLGIDMSVFDYYTPPE